MDRRSGPGSGPRGPWERPARGSLTELRYRLEGLPPGHPSSPYDDRGTLRPSPQQLRQLELPLADEERDSDPPAQASLRAATLGEVARGDVARGEVARGEAAPVVSTPDEQLTTEPADSALAGLLNGEPGAGGLTWAGASGLIASESAARATEAGGAGIDAPGIDTLGANGYGSGLAVDTSLAEDDSAASLPGDLNGLADRIARRTGTGGDAPARRNGSSPSGAFGRELDGPDNPGRGSWPADADDPGRPAGLDPDDDGHADPAAHDDIAFSDARFGGAPLSNGSVANGSVANGSVANGGVANGGVANGSSVNGHAAVNGHEAAGAPSGRAANGRTANGHASSNGAITGGSVTDGATSGSVPAGSIPDGAVAAGGVTDDGLGGVLRPGPLTAEQERIADEVLERHRVADGRNVFGGYGESGLTPAMRRVEANLPRGRLAPDTEENSLKSPERFKEKLARMIARSPGLRAEDLADEIYDAARYTFVFDEQDYTDGTWLVHRRLKAQGFDLEARRNRWDSPEYKGIRTRWRDPAHNLIFEVQFHTPESWDVLASTHEAYLRITDPRTPAAERSRLRSRQVAASAACRPPARCAEIADFRAEAR